MARRVGRSAAGSALSRRRFLASAAAVGAVVSPGAQQVASGPRPAFAVDALGLAPAARADLEAFAEPVLREAAWLDDLPLDHVSPAFRFSPEGEDA